MDLAPEIEARGLGNHRGLSQVTVLLVGVVHPLEIVANPANVVLSRNNLQARESFQYPAEDCVTERALDGVRQGRIALHNTGTNTAALTAGEDVHGQRYSYVLGRSPKGIPDRVVIGLIVRWDTP